MQCFVPSYRPVIISKREREIEMVALLLLHSYIYVRYFLYLCSGLIRVLPTAESFHVFRSWSDDVHTVWI